MHDRSIYNDNSGMKGFMNSLRKVTPLVHKHQHRRDEIMQHQESRELREFLDLEQEKKFQRREKALTSMMSYKEFHNKS